MKHLAATVTKATEFGTWSAVASAPTLDRDGEVVAAFAFAPLPESVPVHEGHDFSKVVGRAVPRYDSRGTLLLDGRFSSVPEAQRVRTMVLEGVIDSMSVAFHDPVRENRKGVPTIVSAELLSVDFVSVPSNRDARVLAARSYGSGRGSTDVVRAQIFALETELMLLDLDLDRDRRSRKSSTPGTLAHAYATLAECQAFLSDLRR